MQCRRFIRPWFAAIPNARLADQSGDVSAESSASGGGLNDNYRDTDLRARLIRTARLDSRRER